MFPRICDDVFVLGLYVLGVIDGDVYLLWLRCALSCVWLCVLQHCVCLCHYVLYLYDCVVYD